MRRCANCGTEVGAIVYGRLECGAHLVSDFIEKRGYVMPLPKCFADWDAPDKFAIAEEDMPVPTRIWQHKDRCCTWWREPIADEEDYCPKCKDVVEVTLEGINNA